MKKEIEKLWEKYPQIKFCRVRKKGGKYKGKEPIGLDWPNKPYSFAEIKPFLLKGENYGIIAGIGNLAIIDCDEPGVLQKVKSILPDSLTVKTAKGHHVYYFCDEFKDKVVMTDAQGKHWGEVQSTGTMVVGPGSTHETGVKYELQLNEDSSLPDIQSIPLPKLESVIQSFTAPPRPIAQVTSSPKPIQHVPLFSNTSNNYNFDEVDIDRINITDIWPTAGMQQRANGDYFGSHPVHGSTGGQNFHINPDTNIWHCHRCNSGGGALSAIAVANGIVQCGDVTKGSLRDDSARQAIAIAAENGWGVTSASPLLFDTDKLLETKKVKRDKPTIIVRDFDYYETLKPDNNYFVKDFIKPKTVTMIYSPPAQFKSFLALHLAMCVSCGEPWLGLKTKKNSVLYLDGENNESTVRKRLMGLREGCGFDKKEAKGKFGIIDKGVIMDGKKNLHMDWLNVLSEKIIERGAKIIFIDTLHRYCGYDENSSDDINKLYVEVFQPLISKLGISIVFLHHSSKAGGYRGSGDFLGMVDTAYSVSRGVKKGNVNSFLFKNEKNRDGEQDTIAGEMSFPRKIWLEEKDEDGDYEEDYTVVKISQTNIITTTVQNAEEGQAVERNQILSVFESENIRLRKAEIIARLTALNVDIPATTLKRRIGELREKNRIIFDDKDNTYRLFVWDLNNYREVVTD